MSGGVWVRGWGTPRPRRAAVRAAASSRPPYRLVRVECGIIGAMNMMLIFCCLMSFVGFAHDFYVWQRKWDAKVDAAVQEELSGGSHGLYVLGGEVEYEDGRAVWKQVSVPTSLWRESRVTAVFRLPVKALEDPSGSAQSVVRQAEKLAVRRLQLDVDVPESKLEKYAELLATLRANPAWKFEFIGATFLPCHLGQKKLATVLSLVDEPVIQLHGIDAPKCRSEDWGLMKRKMAFSAMKMAGKLDARFKMALPTYAYVLFFANDGSFRRLFAEGLGDDDVPFGTDTTREIAAPDLALLHELLTSSDSLPVIWFRLPVKGLDRWTLEKDTVLRLERGELPQPSLEIEMRAQSAAVIDVYATYRHQIPLNDTEVLLAWGEETKGEFFPMNATRIADGSVYGVLPEKISVAPHAAGQSFIVGKAIKDFK